MTIEEIKSKSQVSQFLDLPKELYKNDPNWVCPLDNDIESIFDPAKNSYFTHGSVTRWLIKNDQGKVIGRIAAFINEKKAFTYKVPTGGCGFFECIDNQNAADQLFDTAKNWLKERGMQAMLGPINFGENDMWWGLLVEGFTMPYFGMNYNHPYYKRLFENYGFQQHMEQISNRLDPNVPFPERFTKIAEWVAKKPGYTFEHFRMKDLRKFTKDFVEIYNEAWTSHDNFSPLQEEAVLHIFETMKPILDENMIWFSYVKGEPAAMVVIIPDANFWLKNLKGKLDLFGKIKFLYNKTFSRNDRIRAVAMGVKEKFQKHGLESAMFIKLKEYVIPLHQYKELELSWVGDFNTKMISIHEATGATFSKKHITYIYSF